MQPTEPELSAYNADEEPWRLRRLARTDGRVRELLRVLTRERGGDVSSVGEDVWARHVRTLHDNRGTLEVVVTAALVRSPWFPLIAAAVARAWDGEDEPAVAFRAEGGGRPMAFAEVLPATGPDAAPG